MSAPALRFKDDEGRNFPDWKATLLDQVATFTKGKGLSKADIAENGATPCIRYGELYTEYGATIHDVKSKTNVDVAELVFSQSNDVIIPASGETQIDIATASCVQLSGIALGGDLNIIRSKLDGVFLSYYLNSQKKLDIAKLAQGNSVVHLYSSQLKQLELNVPSKFEQTKIANFLTAVDEKLAQLTRKHDLLTQYKKGVMQQIFSQELRFKDDDGLEFAEWKEHELGDLCSTFKSGLGITSEKINEQGEYPVFGGNGLRGYSDSYTHDGFYVLIGRQGALCGNINRSRGKAYISEHAIAVCANESADTQWLAYRLDYMKLNRLSESSAQPGLSVNKIVKIKLHAPSKAEQTKIANFLTSIDDKITATQTQLAAVKQYKQGLLQQMFV